MLLLSKQLNKIHFAWLIKLCLQIKAPHAFLYCELIILQYHCSVESLSISSKLSLNHRKAPVGHDLNIYTVIRCLKWCEIAFDFLQHPFPKGVDYSKKYFQVSDFTLFHNQHCIIMVPISPKFTTIVAQHVCFSSTFCQVELKFLHSENRFLHFCQNFFQGCSWKPFLWIAETWLTYRVNTMTTDDLVAQGVSLSTAMV